MKDSHIPLWLSLLCSPNTYVHSWLYKKICFCLWLKSPSTGYPLRGRSLTSPWLIGLLTTWPLRQKVRGFASLVLRSVHLFGGYQSGYSHEAVVNSQAPLLLPEASVCADSNVFHWLKGGLCELLMLSSSTNRACIDQQSLE